jgi:hypothetical protein
MAPASPGPFFWRVLPAPGRAARGFAGSRVRGVPRRGVPFPGGRAREGRRCGRLVRRARSFDRAVDSVRECWCGGAWGERPRFAASRASARAGVLGAVIGALPRQCGARRPTSRIPGRRRAFPPCVGGTASVAPRRGLAVRAYRVRCMKRAPGRWGGARASVARRRRGARASAMRRPPPDARVARCPGEPAADTRHPRRVREAIRRAEGSGGDGLGLCAVCGGPRRPPSSAADRRARGWVGQPGDPSQSLQRSTPAGAGTGSNRAVPPRDSITRPQPTAQSPQPVDAACTGTRSPH